MIWAILVLVYWLSLGIITYTYIGYPLVVSVLSALKPRIVGRSPIVPSLSVVLAVRNEAALLETKLENLFALDYPSDKKEIIVISDGSNDETNEIIKRYRKQDIKYQLLSECQGKAAAINIGVALASGEILVFCDARQRIDELALRALVQPFEDQSVGCVSAMLCLEGNHGPGAYWAYEKRIRLAESHIDSVPGATGALYSIRRGLYTEIPIGCLLDDVFIPMKVITQGYRAILEPQAKVFDKEASNKGEFARKARTLAGNFQLLQLMPEILDPLKNRIFWIFASHKLMRLICPFVLVLLAVTNLALVFRGAFDWLFYALTLVLQVGVYGFALVGLIKGVSANRITRLCYTFVSLNLAATLGLFRFLRNDYRWTSNKNR